MSIFDKFLSSFGLARKAAQLPAVSGVSDGSNPFAIFGGSGKISARKAMALYNNWVYSCIRAISEEIANAHFKLYRLKADGTSEEISDHPLLDLLEGVNNFQTGFELRYLTASHLEMVGNAYWFLDGVKSATDVPTAIYPLNPANISIIRGQLPTPIKAFKYEIMGQNAQTFTPEQIIHLKYPDPSDMVEGLGTIQSILQWIDADNYATEFNRRFFENGARIGGLLKSDQSLNRDQLEYLQHSFEDNYAGVENAYRVSALPKGTDYVEMGSSAKEMDFVEGQKLTRDKILAGFRVPKTILGSSESETNRATAETANYVFALRTIKPKLELLTSYLNEFLVPRFGSDLYLDFENVVPQDRDLEIRELSAALLGQPSISVNEARDRYLGLGPIDHGDDVMTDFSKIPLGAPTKALRKPSVKAKKAQAGKTTHAKNAKMRSGISESIAKEAARLAAEASKIAHKTVADMTDDEFEAVWKAFVSRVTPYEKATISMIQKFNGKQEQEVIANLAEATKDIDPDDLYDLDGWSSDMADLATPILQELFEKEGLAAAALIGRSDLDVLTPDVKKALDKAISHMAKSYNETTLGLLKTKLEEGLQQGLSQPELKKIIKDVYEFSNDSRALAVARTETFRIANDATRSAWKQSGVVKDLKWYTAVDERVCEFCAPLQGTIVDIDSNFFNKGDVVTGSDGGQLSVEYADVSGGSLHPNCRCYIRPETIEI